MPNRAPQYPKSLVAVTSGVDPLARIFTDRSKPLSESVVYAAVRRSVFSWQGREPQPGYDDKNNIVNAGDLDLSSFFVELALRRAIIEIRGYQNRRPLVLKVGMRKIGDVSFGAVRRLVSHQEALSFSIHIRDQSIVMDKDGTEEIGHPMNYMVVDIDGTWYDGCATIHFKPNAAENEFLTRYNLVVDNALKFKYFVHPNRWQSIFGAPYVLLKTLVIRMDDEATYYRKELKRLNDLGITPDRRPRDEYESGGDTSRVRIRSFAAKLEGVQLEASVDDYGLPKGDTKERAQAAYDRQRLITYTWKPMAQFIIRADELAYFKYGMDKDMRPAWAADLEILPKKSRGQTWMQMPLPDGKTLSFRAFDLDQDVAA